MRRTLERMLPTLLGALALGVLGCDDDAEDFDIDAAVFGDADPGDIELNTYVFTATNDPGGNEVVAWAAFEDGTLVERVRASTGGAGANLTGDSADPLGSQDSLIFVEDYIFVVNAGSNTVSSFEWDERDADETPLLELLSVESSGGAGPLSVTYYDENLWVVNTDGTIQGFDVDEGVLSPKPRGTANLATGAIPASIDFQNSGDDLLVTDRSGNQIVLVELSDGLPENVRAFPSVGTTPIGGEFIDDDVFVVANANAPDGNPVANAGSVTTYELEDEDDPPKTIEAEFASGETGSARVTSYPGLDWIFTSNQVSGSLTAIEADSDGDLGEVRTTAMPAGSVPLDLSYHPDDDFVYVLDGGRGVIGVYRLDEDEDTDDDVERLLPVNENAAAGLPEGVYGLDVQRGDLRDIDTDW